MEKCQKPSFNLNFSSLTARTQFEEKFAHHEIKARRIIDFDFLQTLDFLYTRIFENFGWMNYFHMNLPIYENLVRAFYSNAELLPRPEQSNRFYSNKFRTYLMGKEFVVNKELIATTLNLVNDGEIDPRGDILDLAKLVFNDVSLPFAPIQASEIGMFNRLLHLIVTHVLALFGTKYSSIRK